MEADGPMNFSTQEARKAVANTLKLRMAAEKEGNGRGEGAG
jgi:hypothetical protein